jgi:hypothetical protein
MSMYWSTCFILLPAHVARILACRVTIFYTQQLKDGITSQTRCYCRTQGIASTLWMIGKSSHVAGHLFSLYRTRIRANQLRLCSRGGASRGGLWGKTLCYGDDIEISWYRGDLKIPLDDSTPGVVFARMHPRLMEPNPHPTPLDRFLSVGYQFRTWVFLGVSLLRIVFLCISL